MQPDPTPLHLAEKTPPGGPVSTGLAAHVARLNLQMRHHSAAHVIETALRHITPLRLVSSFGAESVALLHLAATVDRDIPVIFVDTELLFTETLVYQQELAERLGLRNLRIQRSTEIAQRDPHNDLHLTNPDACCDLRKTVPLQRALTGANGWITGRKRFQSTERAALNHFEVEPLTDRIKVNPLAFWRTQDVADYIDENRLPRHPLVARGYPSIGCTPCTSRVAPGEDPRAGRWRDQTKTECGIHFPKGQPAAKGAQK